MSQGLFLLQVINDSVMSKIGKNKALGKKFSELKFWVSKMAFLYGYLKVG